MNIDKIKEKLKENLDDKNGKVIALNGEWGVGKTHFWHEFMAGTSTFEYVYVSLYGKHSVEEIKNDIAAELSLTQEFIRKAEDNSGIWAEYIPIFKLFRNDDVHNVIISFDDFERMSKKIDLKDILGLITDLKDDKNCRIVLILNESKVNSEDFSLGKEKVIDYEYLYNPSVSFALEHSNTKRLKFFQENEMEFFLKKYTINNIRVLSKIVNVLVDLEEILVTYKDEPYFDALNKNLLKTILPLLYIYYRYNFYDFSALVKYSSAKIKSRHHSGSANFDFNNEYDEYLNYFNGKRLNQNRLFSIVHHYIRYGYYNEGALKRVLHLESNVAAKKVHLSDFKNLRKNLFYNFSEAFEKSSSELIEFMEKKKKILAFLFNNLGDYYKEIDEISKIDQNNESAYKGYFIYSSEQYLNYYRDNYPEYFFDDNFLKDFESISDLNEMVLDIMNDLVKGELETFIGIINKFQDSYYYNPESYEKELLLNVQDKTIIELLNHSADATVGLETMLLKLSNNNDYEDLVIKCKSLLLENDTLCKIRKEYFLERIEVDKEK